MYRSNRPSPKKVQKVPKQKPQNPVPKTFVEVTGVHDEDNPKVHWGESSILPANNAVVFDEKDEEVDSLMPIRVPLESFSQDKQEPRTIEEIDITHDAFQDFRDAHLSLKTKRACVTGYNILAYVKPTLPIHDSEMNHSELQDFVQVNFQNRQAPTILE